MNNYYDSVDKNTGEIKPAKLRNTMNYDYIQDSEPEHNYLPSLTVPDMTMTVSEILQKHAIGQPIMGQAGEPLYYDDEELPDPKKMDITELHEYMEDNKRIIAQAEEENRRMQEEQKRRNIEEAYERRKASESADPGQAAEKKSKTLKTPPEAKDEK